MTSGLIEGERLSLAMHRLRALVIAVARPWVPIALGLTIVVGVGVVTARTVAASEQFNQLVQVSMLTVSAADGVMLAIAEMNSSQRGYILNRNEEFRGRYASTRHDLETNLAQLHALAPLTEVGQSRLASFDAALEERMQAFAEVDRFIDSNDFVGAGEFSSSARLYTDDMRNALTAVKADARETLQARRTEASESSDLAVSLTIAGLAIASVLILVSIGMLLRKTSQLQLANNEVHGLAANLELRVAERTTELAQANEEIQRFAYIVSHDLRSPLVNIMGFTAELDDVQQTVADFLSRAKKTGKDSIPHKVRTAVIDEMPEAMGFIRASTARMDRLIKAILQLSREGRRSLMKESIALDALFAGIADSLSGQVGASNAKIQIGSLPVVEGDQIALEQIFGNLLDNAVKYLRPDVQGRISVTGETLVDRVVIRIADNGRGLAQTDLVRIFELFRRAGEQDQPGEGIGLAYVQTLVRRLGGHISVVSELGEGTTFTVNLPQVMALR